MIFNLLLKARLVLFVLGFATFFADQRYLAVESYHMYVLCSALVLMVVATLLPLIAALQAKQKNLRSERTSWLMVFAWQAVVLAGLGVYLGYEKLLENALAPETFTNKALLAAWLLLLNFGLFFGVGVELAHRSSGLGKLAESRRVGRAGIAWLMVGMVLTFLVCFNYVGAKKDKAFDWSYLKTTTPGEATVNLLKEAKEPVKVILFFPTDNDVRPLVHEYFDFLAKAAPNVSVGTIDKDLNPSKAEQYKVSRNGQVIFSAGEKQERLDIGTELKEARSTLKKLDAEVQKNYLRLTESKKTVYFSRGHGEASWLGSERSPLKSIGLLEKFLRSQNYSLKMFGLSEGSGTTVPDDAAAVVVVGPESPFMKEEIEALRAYVRKGGKLMVFLDVDRPGEKTTKVEEAKGKDPLLEFLAEAGLHYTGKMLANDRNYISGTRSPVDKWFIYSNSFTSHESVATLAKHDEKIALIMFQSGYFDVDARQGDWKGYATVRALSDTFIDLNKNFAFDQGKEERKTYTLAGVAVMGEEGAAGPADPHANMPGMEKPKTDEPAKAGPAEAGAQDKKSNQDSQPVGPGKIVALADAALVSDVLIKNPANAVFVNDSLKWLMGKQSVSGEVASEEDVKIQHSRKEDVLWFNGTVIGMPLLVLGVGFFATRRKRRSKSSR